MSTIGKIAIIGGGAMGSAFAKGIIAAGLLRPEQITVADLDESRLAAAAETGARTTSDNSAAIDGADVVMLAVKPWIVANVLDEIGTRIKPSQLVMSLAAGVKLNSIESRLPSGIGVVRAMPNTPCLIGMGAVGYCLGKSATREQAGVAQSLFDAVGVSAEVSEKQMDAVTGLSGSGPAYIYVLIEALSDAGVRVGLARAVATKLAAQTVAGAARMVLETGEYPGALKDQVTTPGGTTITALDVLERLGFRSAVIEAVKAAAKRSEEMG